MAEYITADENAAERLVRCKECKWWRTGIAYSATGECTHEDNNRLICNANFFCGRGSVRA